MRYLSKPVFNYVEQNTLQLFNYQTATIVKIHQKISEKLTLFWLFLNKTKNWDKITNISTAAIALSALIFSVFSFKTQLDQAERISIANVKPLLRVHGEKYTNLKSIQISNYGSGPAVISSASFCRLKKECTNNIVELFDLPVIWDDYYNMPAKMAIPPQGNVVLVKLSLENLKNNNIQEDKALKILKEWQKQKSEITVRVIYKDILGNIQPEMSFRLK